MTKEYYLSKTALSAIVDVVLLMVVYFLPSIVHTFPFPIYYMEPMRVALFLSILLLNDRRNAYLLAFTLPLFSYIVSGHPVVVKNMLMAIELSSNVFILNKLTDRGLNVFMACVVSIVGSKMIYYVMKLAVIQLGLLSASMVATPIIYQIGVTFVISALFVIVNHKKNPH